MTQFELKIGTKKEIREALIEKKEKEEFNNVEISDVEKKKLYDHYRNKKFRKIKKYSDIKYEWLKIRIGELHKRIKRQNKNFGCTLTPEELLSLIPKDLKCPIFRTKFVFDNSDTLSNLSVDRIINSLGYFKENVVIVSLRANAIKSTATVKELYKVADFYHKIEKNKVDN